MTKKTYTENLEAILERLETQEEIKALVKEQNGALKKHGEVLAAHCQWIESHEGTTHEALDNRIDRVDRKTNIVGAISAAFAGIAALFAGSKG